MRRNAFTLVELLVVIGVIALLIAILLPTLGRARDNANRVACAKNLQQAGTALLLYINTNKGSLPQPGKVAPSDADALWWQPARIAEMRLNGIAPYMRLSSDDLRLFRCPADGEADTRRGAGKYPLTYSFNNNMGGDGPQPVKKLTQIRVPASKIYVIEENGPTLDDASVDLWARTGQWAKVGMLGLRHDRINRKIYPDTSSAATGIVNRLGKANALFADFHVEYVERSYAHAKSRALPDALASAFAADAETLP